MLFVFFKRLQTFEKRPLIGLFVLVGDEAPDEIPEDDSA